MAEVKNTATPVAAVRNQVSCLVCDSVEQGQGHGGEMQVQQHRARDQRLVAEHQHEGEQVERERQHPQQRRGGDVGRDMGGEGRQQRRRHQRQADPAQAIRPGRRRGGIASRRPPAGAPRPRCPARSGRRASRRRPAPAPPPAAGSPASTERLSCLQPERRLEHEGIAQQRDQAAEVARRIQEIGIVAMRMPGAGEPGLQQRRVGRQRRGTAGRSPP